eukprot:5740437-Pyramimonas_sp.AAC.2
MARAPQGRGGSGIRGLLHGPEERMQRGSGAGAHDAMRRWDADRTGAAARARCNSGGAARNAVRIAAGPAEAPAARRFRQRAGSAGAQLTQLRARGGARSIRPPTLGPILLLLLL